MSIQRVFKLALYVQSSFKLVWVSAIDTRIEEGNRMGGCFGTGPGRLKTRQADVLVEMGGKFKFMSLLMDPNSTYEFTVIGHKGSRSGSASHKILVAVDEPPPVEIQ